VTGVRVTAERPEQIPAVLCGHEHVERDDIRAGLAGEPERARSGARLEDPIGVIAQQPREEECHVGVVVNHQERPQARDRQREGSLEGHVAALLDSELTGLQLNQLPHRGEASAALRWRRHDRRTRSGHRDLQADVLGEAGRGYPDQRFDPTFDRAFEQVDEHVSQDEAMHTDRRQVVREVDVDARPPILGQPGHDVQGILHRVHKTDRLCGWQRSDFGELVLNSLCSGSGSSRRIRIIRCPRYVARLSGLSAGWAPRAACQVVVALPEQ